MSYQSGCSGCEAVTEPDALKRAHALLDAHVASGGYDLYGPLTEAIDEAAKLRREGKPIDAKERTMSEPTKLTEEEREELDKQNSHAATERVTYGRCGKLVMDRAADFFARGKDDEARLLRQLAIDIGLWEKDASERQHGLLKQLHPVYR